MRFLDDQEEGRAGELVLAPPESRWGTVTATVYGPDGEALETPTPTVASTVLRVADDAANTSWRFKVDTVSGVVRGATYEVVDPDFGTVMTTISRIDADALFVTLLEPLPATPQDGAPMTAADITVPLTTTTTDAGRGIGYRVVVRNSTTGERLDEEFAVVRSPFRSPLTAREIRRHIADVWPSDSRADDPAFHAWLADEVAHRIRTRLRASDLYADRMWDRAALREPCFVQLDLLLAERNMLPPRIDDPLEFKRARSFDLRDAMDRVIRAAMHDNDDDGKLEETEQRAFRSFIGARG